MPITRSITLTSVLAALAIAHCPATLAVSQPTNPAIEPSCPEYITKGEWVYRYNEWVLSLTPSVCGRQIDSTETGLMFYEIVRKFSGSRFWANDRGLVNQLTCHLVIARNKPEWNLEPWRPYVGHNETVAQQCNVTVPAPDTPFH